MQQRGDKSIRFREKMEEQKQESDGRCYTAGFEGGGRGSRRACRQPAEAGELREADSGLQPPDGTQACRNLSFSPGKLILDFCSPEL